MLPKVKAIVATRPPFHGTQIALLLESFERISGCLNSAPSKRLLQSAAEHELARGASASKGIEARRGTVDDIGSMTDPIP